MKKITLLLFVLLTGIFAYAGDLTGIKIYVNPGHGGHDSANDRNIVTIPFAANDPLGYWESNSNLAKGLALRDLLQNVGATVLMSRTQNRDEDDRALSSIVAEANANNPDAFLSIHSNAGGALTNYDLMLYAGVDPTDTWKYPTATPYSDESRALSTYIGNNIVTNQLTVWTTSSPQIRGDKTFGRLVMGGWSDGYGVLRGLAVPGLISEGEFHEYKPEAHRLLNNDYCALEAYQFYRAFCSYFGRPQATTGVIAGYVKSGNEIINHPMYAYIAKSQDQWLPLNGATVKLYDETGDTELATYTTDNWYNGVFAFYNLNPGNYKLKISATEYENKTIDIAVSAGQTAYAKVQLNNERIENEIPVANIYASGLAIEGNNFEFTLNEDAETVSLSIHKNGETIMSFNGGAMKKGVHSIENPFGSVEFDSWSVTPYAASVNRPMKISNAETRFQFNGLRGVAIDNNPESPYFGRIYASEGLGGAASGRTTQDGIYILDALLQDVTAQGASAYTGGVSWFTSGASPYRLAVDSKGQVYISDWSDAATSGVWVMDPENPSAPFRSIFGGSVSSIGLATANGVEIHGSVSDCKVLGSGENTALYTFDEDMLAPGRAADETYIRGGNLFRYDIGSSTTPWTSTASEVVYDDVANGNLQKNGNSQIAYDGRGGWWISQYRAEGDATTPVLIHVPQNGTVDYNSASDIKGSYQGGMAVTEDGSMLAIGSNGTVRLFSVEFEDDGKPVLTLLYTLIHGSDYTYSCAFDVAGNLYAAHNKELSVWAIPKSTNSCTTSIKSSGFSGIKSPASETAITIYPNPAKSEFVIDGHGTNLKSYRLFDLNGQVMVSDKIGGNKKTVSVINLQSGDYILQIEINTGTVVKRIIKN